MLDPFWNPPPNESNGVPEATRALWALVNAVNWEETRSVLTERQAILLTDPALTLLRIIIENLFAQNEIAEAENWSQYLSLLEDASAYGIDGAWSNFISTQNKAIDALEALINADANNEKLVVLEREQALLIGSTTARVILRGSISKQREQHDEELAEYLEKLLLLLEDAQISGIPPAWNRYKAL